MDPIYARLRQALASHIYGNEYQRRLLTANLERARVLPSGNGRYVIVNPPAARLDGPDLRAAPAGARQPHLRQRVPAPPSYREPRAGAGASVGKWALRDRQSACRAAGWTRSTRGSGRRSPATSTATSTSAAFLPRTSSGRGCFRREMGA